jgi:hypothetical protein
MRSKLGKNSQQWIFDYIIRTTGKTAHWELDALLDRLPIEVKSWDMIPKIVGKQAAREEAFARKAEAAGHYRTAWEAYAKACVTYFTAQHIIVEDDNSEKIRLYQRLLDCNEKVRQYSEHPIEKIEIPWGNKTIPALFHLVPDRKKAPCIIYIPGMDQAKEMFPGSAGNMIVTPNPFITRGIHAISIDLPGQGECNLRKMRATADNHMDAGKAVVDYVYSLDRLMYPLKRKKGGWKRISWDEALDIISEKLKQIKDDYGAHALAIFCGSIGVENHELATFARRFRGAYGTPNFFTVDSN